MIPVGAYDIELVNHDRNVTTVQVFDGYTFAYIGTYAISSNAVTVVDGQDVTSNMAWVVMQYRIGQTYAVPVC